MSDDQQCDAMIAFSANGFRCCRQMGHRGEHRSWSVGQASRFPHGSDHQVRVDARVRWADR